MSEALRCTIHELGTPRFGQQVERIKDCSIGYAEQANAIGSSSGHGKAGCGDGHENRDCRAEC